MPQALLRATLALRDADELALDRWYQRVAEHLPISEAADFRARWLQGVAVTAARGLGGRAFDTSRWASHLPIGWPGAPILPGSGAGLAAG